MRSNGEFAAEAQRRAAVLKRKGRARRVAYAAAFACLAFAAYFAVPSGLMNLAESLPVQGSVTILDGAVAGGYVLVSVAAFALGVATAVLCLKLKKKE